jgi:hypothetical protein
VLGRRRAISATEPRAATTASMSTTGSWADKTPHIGFPVSGNHDCSTWGPQLAALAADMSARRSSRLGRCRRGVKEVGTQGKTRSDGHCLDQRLGIRLVSGAKGGSRLTLVNESADTAACRRAESHGAERPANRLIWCRQLGWGVLLSATPAHISGSQEGVALLGCGLPITHRDRQRWRPNHRPTRRGGPVAAARPSRRVRALSSMMRCHRVDGATDIAAGEAV